MKLEELGEFGLISRHLFVEHPVGCLVAAKLVPQPGPLDGELIVQSLLVARVHRASARRTRR